MWGQDDMFNIKNIEIRRKKNLMSGTSQIIRKWTHSLYIYYTVLCLSVKSADTLNRSSFLK